MLVLLGHKLGDKGCSAGHHLSTSPSLSGHAGSLSTRVSKRQYASKDSEAAEMTPEVICPSTFVWASTWKCSFPVKKDETTNARVYFCDFFVCFLSFLWMWIYHIAPPQRPCSARPLTSPGSAAPVQCLK